MLVLPEFTEKTALSEVNKVITHILMDIMLAEFGVIHMRNPYIRRLLKGDVAISQAFCTKT